MISNKIKIKIKRREGNFNDTQTENIQTQNTSNITCSFLILLVPTNLSYLLR